MTAQMEGGHLTWAKARREAWGYAGCTGCIMLANPGRCSLIVATARQGLQRLSGKPHNDVHLDLRVGPSRLFCEGYLG